MDDFINFISFSLEKKIHQEFSFYLNHPKNSLFVCLVGDFDFLALDFCSNHHCQSQIQQFQELWKREHLDWSVEQSRNFVMHLGPFVIRRGVQKRRGSSGFQK